MAVTLPKVQAKLEYVSPSAMLLKCLVFDRTIAYEIGGKWKKSANGWVCPLRPENVDRVVQYFGGRVWIDPTVVGAVEAVRQQEEQAEVMKNAGWEKAEPLAPMPIKTKPFQHQILAFNVGITLNHAAFLMEQGTGKTLATIAVIGHRFLSGQVKRVLIVAPTSVVPVWPKEFDAHADFPFECHALQGTVAKRSAFLDAMPVDPDRVQVAVVNYEATWRMEDALARWSPDMIVLDESQRIKTPGAKQSKTIHRLGKKAVYRLILTGTPVTNSPLDFFSQYKFLDPTIFGDNYYSFRNRYAVMGGYQNKVVVDYKNMDELTSKAHRVAFRVRKEECLDLPEQVDQVLYCDLEPKAARYYKELRREAIAYLNQETVVTAQNVLTELLRLAQITGGYIQDDDGGVHHVSTAKMKVLEEIIDERIAAGKKVVVFARFTAEVAGIESMLRKKKIGFVTIDGGVPIPKRGEAVERFQNDPECKVFVGQIQAVREGLTLTSADTCVFYALNFNYADYAQAKARIHRIGQRNRCTYIHILAKGTVDEKIHKALQAKRSLADLVVDNWREVFA